MILALAGFALPGILLIKEILAGNGMPVLSAPLVFIKHVMSSHALLALASGLFISLLVFVAWTWNDARRYRINNVWAYWLLAFLFGLSGAFPLFLYARESAREKLKARQKKRKGRHEENV